MRLLHPYCTGKYRGDLLSHFKDPLHQFDQALPRDPTSISYRWTIRRCRETWKTHLIGHKVHLNNTKGSSGENNKCMPPDEDYGVSNQRAFPTTQSRENDTQTFWHKKLVSYGICLWDHLAHASLRPNSHLSSMTAWLQRSQNTLTSRRLPDQGIFLCRYTTLAIYHRITVSPANLWPNYSESAIKTGSFQF